MRGGVGAACRSQEDPVANLQFGSCSNSPKKLTDRHGGQEPAANGQVARIPAAPDHGKITPVFTPSRATSLGKIIPEHESRWLEAILNQIPAFPFS